MNGVPTFHQSLSGISNVNITGDLTASTFETTTLGSYLGGITSNVQTQINQLTMQTGPTGPTGSTGMAGSAGPKGDNGDATQATTSAISASVSASTASASAFSSAASATAASASATASALENPLSFQQDQYIWAPKYDRLATMVNINSSIPYDRNNAIAT